MSEIVVKKINTPMGMMKLTASKEALLSVQFMEDDQLEGLNETRMAHQILDQTSTALEAYFNGQLKSFAIPLQPAGTPFQQKVWKILMSIPYGETISYKALAKRLGDVKAIRAAATANGKNPIPIIIPCHRVIGSNGKLVGFSGGLHRKEWLLHHEALFTQQALF